MAAALLPVRGFSRYLFGLRVLLPFLVHVILLVILVTFHSSVQRNKGPSSHLSIALNSPRGELLLTWSLRDLTWVSWDGTEISPWIFFSCLLFIKKKNQISSLFSMQSWAECTESVHRTLQSYLWSHFDESCNHRGVDWRAGGGGLVLICIPLQQRPWRFSNKWDAKKQGEK